MAQAWHLRNDGKAFPVEVHIYPMQDDNLASEAETAAFLISTKSKDQDLAEYTLDAFMALLIEEMNLPYDADEATLEEFIADGLNHLPFRFSYPLKVEEMLQIHRNQSNFNDIDTLYEFVDEVKRDISNIWTEIKDSFNQQFCRVRFGGKFNSTAGNRGIWFRIASVGYNWDNNIYMFAADMKNQLGIQYITICRDAESDGVEEEYFYKAKDGTAYHMMPIEEFFAEEHERNPVFSATEIGAGVINSLRKELRKGNTVRGAYQFLAQNGIECSRDYRPYFLKDEMKNSCIEASQWFDELKTRTKTKIGKMISVIRSKFPEILGMDVDYADRENRKGNMVGFELLCKLVSDHPKIDNIVISVVSTKPLSTVGIDSLVWRFSSEYTDYLNFMNIKVT